MRAQLRFSFKLKSYGSFSLKGCVACAFGGAVSRQALKKGMGKKPSQKIQSSWYFLWLSFVATLFGCIPKSNNMRNFDVTKNETVFFQHKKERVFSKVTGWPLFLLLLFTLIAGVACAQAPTLSYSTPNTYKQGVAITPLAPTAGGVAAFGYGSTFVTVPSAGVTYPRGCFWIQMGTFL